MSMGLYSELQATHFVDVVGILVQNLSFELFLKNQD